MIPKLVYENDIGSVTFNAGTPGAYIEKVTSYGAQNVEFQTTQSNREIGEVLQHQNVSPKTITIKGAINGKSDGLRDQMNHVIAPLAKGRLIYNDEYEMEVYVKASPDIDRQPYGAKFSFSLYAPFPYWRNTERKNRVLVGYEPQFMFPWNISDPEPFYLSKAAQVGYVTVVNEGEASVGWTISFLALSAVKNPFVQSIDTGETVKVLKTMAENETLTISTEGEELSVTLTAAGATAINAGNITDERLDEAVCGLMRDGVTGIDTGVLQSQYNAILAELEANLQAVYDGVEKVNVTEYSATLTVAGWTGSGPYTQEVTLAGILGSDTPFVDVDMSGLSTLDDMSDAQDAFGLILKGVCGAGKITFTASAKPKTAIHIKIKVVA